MENNKFENNYLEVVIKGKGEAIVFVDHITYIEENKKEGGVTIHLVNEEPINVNSDLKAIMTHYRAYKP